MSQSTLQPLRVAPPGPKGRFLVGNALDFSRGDWFGFFRRCAREHGDVVSFRFLNVPMCLLTHPDDIESVLVKNSANFVKSRNYKVLKLVLGNGLLTSKGAFWQRQRKLAQPSFRHESVARYSEVIVDSARRMLDGWHDGESRDVHREMTALTLAVVAKSLFGADVSQESANVRHALSEVSTQLLAMSNISFFLPKFVPIPSTMRLRRAVRELDGIIYSIIRERRKRTNHSPDLLQVLLDAHDESGSQMTDGELRDEMMTLFIAGHETTSLVLSWAWYLLAGHPEIEAKLLGELKTVLNGRELRVSDLPALSYTEMVIKETMRLYPPTWAIGREALNGPRVCIGAGFAMMEAVLLLATVAQRFRLTLSSEHPIEMQPLVTLRPKHGIRMTLHAR